MDNVWVIIVAAGQGKRFGGLKQFAELKGIPLFIHTLLPFESSKYIQGIIVVVPKTKKKQTQQIIKKYKLKKIKRIVQGGTKRQLSVKNALLYVPKEIEFVLVHDGVRPLVSQDLIHRVIQKTKDKGACVPALPIHDCLKLINSENMITDELTTRNLYIIQTPQGFKTEILKAAHQRDPQADLNALDDAQLVRKIKKDIWTVRGEKNNIKVTEKEDLKLVEKIIEKNNKNICSFRIGQGTDVHRFTPQRPLFLGGIELPYHLGLEGHSDADVLLHAIIDAILGASALGDIGSHFPDTDPKYLNISSIELLKKTLDLTKKYEIINIDSTIICERPILKPFIPKMQKKIAEIVGISSKSVNIKATTTEGLGFCGKGEGIMAQAIILIRNKDGRTTEST
jgi:2-C-methyl-D-erythritol 4-phosphate cytidylyltransferase/2-C-methyl-D-erythritol 2,4-cyclodiphosphate synthase